MKPEPSTDQLTHELVFLLLPVVLGIVLIWTTKNGKNFLINPPLWLEPWIGKSTFFWSMLGKKGEKYLYYVIGIFFILVGSALIYERLVILAHRSGY